MDLGSMRLRQLPQRDISNLEMAVGRICWQADEVGCVGKRQRIHSAGCEGANILYACGRL